MTGWGLEEWPPAPVAGDIRWTLSYAILAAARCAAGRPIAQADCRIAAIAHVRGATVATRDTPDFAGCEIELIDPWTAACN